MQGSFTKCFTSQNSQTLEQFFESLYIAAFTPENNKKAFSKTGMHPFNRSVIKCKDLAPSLEHSKYSLPPVEVPEPVERFLTIFRQTIEENDEEEVEIDNNNDWGSDEEAGDLGRNSGDAQHEVLFHRQPQSVGTLTIIGSTSARVDASPVAKAHCHPNPTPPATLQIPAKCDPIALSCQYCIRQLTREGPKACLPLSNYMCQLAITPETGR